MKQLKKYIIKSDMVNLSWLIIERGLQIFFLLIVSGMIARYFQPELYGKWQYALTILTLSLTLTYLCGSEVVIPKLIQEPKRDSEIMGSAFAIRVAAGVLGFILTQIILSYIISESEVIMFVRVLALLILFSEPGSIIVAWFQSKIFIAPVVKSRILVQFLKTAFILIILKYTINSILIPIIWVAEGIVLVFLLVKIYLNHQGPILKFNWEYTIHLFRSGTVYWIGLLFMYAFLKIDRIFLAEYSNFNGLGIYSSALQISEAWYTFSGILSQTFSPRYIYINSSKNSINQRLKKMLIIYSSIAILGSLIIYNMSDFLIRIVFGSAYNEAVPLLKISCFISILIFIDSALNSLMLKARATKWVMAKWCLGFLSAIVVNYYFWDSIGIYTPLLGLVIGYIVVCAIGLIYWYQWNSNCENI